MMMHIVDSTKTQPHAAATHSPHMTPFVQKPTYTIRQLHSLTILSNGMINVSLTQFRGLQSNIKVVCEQDNRSHIVTIHCSSQVCHALMLVVLPSLH